MKKIILFLSVALAISSFREPTAKPTAESINAKYFYILPKDKNVLSFEARLKEFEPTKAQISAKLLRDGDTILAKQIANLHGTVKYVKSIDSVFVELTPFEVDEKSPIYKGAEQIKSGYKSALLGCFQTIKTPIVNPFIGEYVSEPTIEFKKGNLLATVNKKAVKENYIFSNNYRDIKLTAISDDVKMDATIKAEKAGNTLLINYVDFASTQIKAKINFTYSTDNNHIELQQLHMDAEMSPMKYSITVLFSNWSIQ